MPLFAILLWLVLTLGTVVLVLAGLGLGLVLLLLAAALARRSLLSLALVPAAIVVFWWTWSFGTWALPRLVVPVVAEHRKLQDENRERPTLEPAKESAHRFVVAEARYHAANGSYFDTPACLVHPEKCIPGYSGAAFLDESQASLGRRGGFVWSFHPGPKAPDSADRGKASASSVVTYALLGVPVDDSGRAHSVCADFRGVCVFPGTSLDGKAACPASCPRTLWGIDETPPVVVAFDPPRAPPGTRVRITGAWPYQTTWSFGGVPVVHYGSGDNGADLEIPEGAVSGRISARSNNGTAVSATDFVVLRYTGLALAPTALRLAAGGEGRISAVASLSDGTTMELAKGVDWTTDNWDVAHADASGRVTASAPGTATFRARFKGFEASAMVRVLAARGGGS
jgi:hypothetical protein